MSHCIARQTKALRHMGACRIRERFQEDLRSVKVIALKIFRILAMLLGASIAKQHLRIPTIVFICIVDLRRGILGAGELAEIVSGS